MTIRKDKIVVVDLEATCWEGYHAPPGQENEIIEIGICLLDPRTGEITQSTGILVTPMFSEISEFCTSLTTITSDLIKREGIAFSEACEILEKEYDTRNRLWASWGAFDRNMYVEQCRRRKMRYPFSKKHTNLKRVFADHYKKRLGMAKALEVTELGMEGTHHRGVDDAYNTARLLHHLVDRYGLSILKRYGF